MECNLTKQAIPSNEVAFDSTAEQSLECDIILPDYCPDIVKILKCELECCITSTQASGERLELTGIAVAKVLYLSDDNPSNTMEVRSIDYKIPYTKNCEMKGQPDNPIIDVNIRTDYVNCRAVSKRRVEVRGAVSHKIRVVSCKEQQAVSDVAGMGVQLKKNILDMTSCVVQTRSQMSVKEELELGAGKPSVVSIIKSRCFAVLTDYKVISGKIVTKGELRLTILYYSSSGEDCGDAVPSPNQIESMEYSVPISQIVDTNGADDECICNVNYQVAGCDIQPKADMDGDNRIIEIDATVNVDAVVHRKEQIVLSADCYCTTHECLCKSVPINLMTLIDTVQDTHMYKETVDLPENIKNILTGWACITDQNVKAEKGQLQVDFKLNLCLIAVDADGAIQFYDNTQEVSHTINIQQGCEQVMFQPTVMPVSMTYSIKGGATSAAEIRCEIAINGCVYCMLRRNVICDVIVDETKPKSRDKNCALTIYYADKGESLWDIAKRYNTAIDSVLEENSLDSDVLEDRMMLLIPMVD